MVEEKRPSIWTLLFTFLKIGASGFGGPYGLILYLEKEMVQRKKWLKSETFWEGVAIGQLTPGPIFFATAVFCGYRLRGVLGGMAAFASIFPAFALSVLFGYLYFYVQKVPTLQGALMLVLAVVVGLLLSALWRERKKFFNTNLQRVIGGLIFLLLVFVHVNPLLVLIFSGGLGAFFFVPAKSG